MKHKVWLWQIFGFAVTTLGGTLLHFLYEWSGESVCVAPFSGVNESTFEHMKLLFWPMLAFALIEGLFFRERENFFCIKLRGALLGLILIPTLFYTINGAFGKTPDWINIAIFFISAAVAFFYEARKFNTGSGKCRFPWLCRVCLFILISIGALFIAFTFAPPTLPLFRDPLTGSYGI